MAGRGAIQSWWVPTPAEPQRQLSGPPSLPQSGGSSPQGPFALATCPAAAAVHSPFFRLLRSTQLPRRASPRILPDPTASGTPRPQEGSRERSQAKPSSPRGPVSLPRQATVADPPGPPLPPSSSSLSGSSISWLNLGAESAKAFSLSFGDFSFTTLSVRMMLNGQ